MTPDEHQTLTHAVDTLVAQVTESQDVLDAMAADDGEPVAETIRLAVEVDRALAHVAPYPLPDDLAARLQSVHRRQVSLWARIRELADIELCTIHQAQTAILGAGLHPSQRVAAAADVGQFLEHTAASLFGHFSELDERLEQLEDRQAEVWSAVAVGSA